MKNRLAHAALVAALSSGVAAAAPIQSSPSAIRNHFDADAQMRPPAFFDFVELGAPGKSDWMVVADSNPPSITNVVVQTVPNRPADAVAAALRRNVSMRDGKLSVALKKSSGQGGILFRMTGPRDFLVLLVDCVGGQARLVSYRGGKPAELAKAAAPFPVEWVFLEISASGPNLSATWNGKPLLSAEDPAPAAGRAGLAAAGPGTPAFDEFVLDPADKP